MKLYLVIKWFMWAIEQAEDSFGAYTGGPDEDEFRENLKQARKALRQLRKLNRKKKCE